MLRSQNPRPSSGPACPEGCCNSSFHTPIIAPEPSESKDSSALNPRFVHLPFHKWLLLGFVAFTFSIGRVNGCGEQYFLGVAFCSITQYYEANGIYTSACSRYLLKEERTCDGLIFLSKYQCISSARLCGSIPTTWIYSHLPASENKRLKRKHDKKTDPEILQQPSVRIRKQRLVAR